MDGGAGPCCHGTGSLRPPSERSQRTDVSPRMTDWGSTVGFHGLSTMPGRVSFPPMGRGAEGIELHCASMVEDLDLIEVGRRPAVWLASENHDLGLLREGSVSIRASQALNRRALRQPSMAEMFAPGIARVLREGKRRNRRQAP